MPQIDEVIRTPLPPLVVAFGDFFEAHLREVNILSFND